MMDEVGIWAEVLFPNVIGLGGQGLSEAVPDSRSRLRSPADLQRPDG